MNTTLRLGLQRPWALGASALLLAAGGGLAACQNTSGTGTGTGMTTTSSSGGGGGGTGGSATVMSYTPMGCGFSIAARPEYTSWQPSAPTVGTSPNIRRVRLGLGGNVQGTTGRADPATEFGVAWQTDEGTLVSEVEWGTSTDPTTWPAANRVSGITWDTPPSIGMTAERMHEAYVCGLSPSTTYYYRVGGGPKGSEVWSPVFSFTTTPKAGSTSTPVTFAITGDSRGETTGGNAPPGINTWQVLQRRLHTLAPTMALFSGDVINLATDQTEWEEWLDKSELDTDGKTYLTLPQLLGVQAHGNHDNHGVLFFGNLVLPQDNVKYPQYGELFYSFDVGPVHVVVMDDAFIVDTTGDANYQPTLTAWLSADLTAANANRAQVPWVIAVMHHPPYSSSAHGMDADVLRGRQYFAPLFQQYHVDISFAGHDHDYERSHPLNVGADVNSPMPLPDNTPAGQGTVYVVCAGSGADPYTKGTSQFTAKSADFTSGALGIYGILTATASSLQFDAHYLQADASDPIVDSFTISK